MPIYRQIGESVEKMAARGILLPDSQLPSVRALAVQLSINPNTIAKAYSELETKGVIYSLPGRGSFIAADRENLRRQALEGISRKLEQTAEEAAHLELTREDYLCLCGGAWDQIFQKEGRDLDPK